MILGTNLATVNGKEVWEPEGNGVRVVELTSSTIKEKGKLGNNCYKIDAIFDAIFITQQLYSINL